MRICVYGAASDISQEMLCMARNVGRIIGKNGHSLTYGGFSKGILGAVAEGAYEYGADILAVAPDTPRKGQPLFHGCTGVRTSADKRIRKKLQAENADLFVVLPTGIGVMDELFEILVLKSYGQLDKRILICNIGGCYQTLLKLLKEQYVEIFDDIDELEKMIMNIHEKSFELIEKNLRARGYGVSCFDTAEQAADYLNSRIDGRLRRLGYAERDWTLRTLEQSQSGVLASQNAEGQDDRRGAQTGGQCGYLHFLSQRNLRKR